MSRKKVFYNPKWDCLYMLYKEIYPGFGDKPINIIEFEDGVDYFPTTEYDKFIGYL